MADTPAAPKVEPTEQDLLIRRWGELETEFSSWLVHGKEISQYLLPRSGRFFTQDRNKGNKRHNNILDSTGTRALRITAAGLMGGGSSPARPWFRLATPDPMLMKSAAVRQWLDDATRLILDVFQRGNTYRALHNMYEEIVTFGTAAAILLDDYEDVVRLYPLTFGEYRIASSPRGEINTLYRRFEMQVSSLVAEFGYDNCSSTVQNLWTMGSLGAWVVVQHSIEPRADRDASKLDSKNMPWKSNYFEIGGDKSKFLRVSGFKTFRVLAPRWSLTGSDIYGTSCPGMESLGDIKQLQHEQLRKAECIDYQTRPPTQSPSSMKNREIDRLPGGNSFVDMSGANGGIKTLFEVNLNLQHLLEDIQDVRQRINQTFYTDLFLMMANDQRSGVTATEITERHEEKLLMLGPVLERLHNELLDPLVTMTFERLADLGLLPEPPQELQKVKLNVEFVSMLAQAQRAVTTNSSDRLVMGLTTIGQSKPSVWDKFNEDAWADDYADSLGTNPKLINDEKRVADIRAERAKQQQAAQQAAMAESASKTAGNLGKVPTGGAQNAFTDATRQFSGYT